MNLTDEQRAEFRKVTEPVIKWLNENCHPHVTVVVRCNSAEASTGVVAYSTEEFLQD